MDKEVTTNHSNIKTQYGVIVILTQDEEVLLSRRLDTPQYAKKWQIPNGRMHAHEASSDACVRILERETQLKIPKDEFSFIGSLTLDQINEFYYIYAVNIPVSINLPETAKKETKHRSDWRFFEFNKAVVLDSAPGVRAILIKLVRNLHRAKIIIANELKMKLNMAETQKLPDVRIPTQEQQQQMVQGCCGL